MKRKPKINSNSSYLLLIVSGIFFFLIGFSFAQNTVVDTKVSIGNCNKVISGDVNANTHKFIPSNPEGIISKVLPQEAIVLAVDHLRSACCSLGHIDNKDICTNTEYVLKSPFLFDHLFDVFMRRLDAEQGGNGSPNLLYGLDPDPQGKEWRDFVNKVGNKQAEASSQNIMKMFTKHRTLSNEYTQNYTIKDTGEFKGKDPKFIQKIAPTYSNWNLVNKYKYACDIAMGIYASMMQAEEKKFTLYAGNIKYSLIDAYKSCKRFVDKRIENEVKYAKIIMSNTYKEEFSSYWETYHKDVTKSKIYVLDEKIQKIVQYLKDVEKAVVKLIGQCS